MGKKIVSFFQLLIGIMIGTIETRKIKKIEIQKLQQMSDKHLSLFLMMNRWLKVKQEGKELASYFEQRGYHEIAVYGMSYVGETFVNELENSNIKVKYGIDRKYDAMHFKFNIFSPNDMLENVDAIVVTPIVFFTEIEVQLSQKINCPIISLEDILFEI